MEATQMPEWLMKQFDNADRTVQTWSEGKRDAAGIPSDRLCRVINLSTLHAQEYTTTPRLAVLSAYAQSIGDWNTWDYESKYGSLVEEGASKWLVCGDFATAK